MTVRPIRLLSFCLALAIANAPLRAAFTLEQVMSAPFASGLSAAPDGKAVAWVLFEQGKRNIYTAQAPGWQGRKATAFNEDDGQEISQLAWSRDSSSLYFTRGGDFEMQRDNPNPDLAISKPEQAIWLLRLDSSVPKKLVDGNAPELCSNATQVFYLKNGQIWQMSADGSGPKQVVALKGKASDLTCSPDGGQLAFVDSRQSHSLIGVYSVTGHSLRYPDPGVDHDSSPVWSPDSSHLAFLRIPAHTRPFEFGPVREGQPFSIHVVDMASGQGREIWHADPGKGSAFGEEIVAKKQIFWGAGNEIVFPWEKTGWRLLYAIPSAGGPPRALTLGDAEVEHVALSEDCSTVYYSTNKDDIDRRHIWKVDLNTSGNPSAVTSGEGIEWAPAPVGTTGAFAFLASDTRHSSHAMIRLTSAQPKALAPQTVPSDFPAGQLVTPEQVILSAADGLKIHAQLFMPPGAANRGKLPAVVFFHGGSRRQMLLGFHYMQYYSNAYAMNQYLASKGYLVLSVNYRSGIGYGMEFREALNYGATGASEFNDVMGAGLYLRDRSDVDSARIGLWGGSYGGYLTALGLSRASSLFKAGVDFHGVFDWNDVLENFIPAYDPKAQPEAARIALESSPMSSIDTWRSPVLLIQGDDDRNVPFGETIKLVEALRNKGVYFELMVLPNEVHDFLLYRSWLKAYAASADFFDRKLTGK
jgi:dipeptidyl aminopeptidase/acylaminoacyl peptidase